MTGAASSSRNVPKTANPRLEVIELSDTDDEPDSESEHETGADGQPIKDAGVDNDDNDESAKVDSDAGEQGVWESESLLEDTLGEMGDGVLFEPHEDACTLEEATEFRKLLKKIGDERFLDGTIRNKSISAKKLITAFGIRPPAFLEDAPDHAFYPLLRMGISRELMRRSKLPHINTLADVTKLLRESENIIVLTGAGISTSLGIPDFRSKEGGLYSRLEGLGLNDPQEVFDIGIFQEDPTIFYSVAKDILPASSKFSPTHAFIELLQRKGKLLTQYTQNIDNLEEKAGIRKDKLIQCHGSFATASCVKCHTKVPGQTIFPDLRAGRVARCESCLKTLADVKKAGKKRKRGKSRESSGARKKRYSEDSSAEEEEWDIQEAGIMKPDITFFGEPLPDHFHRRLVDHDRDKCDLLICIGTSLQVAPVSEIIGFLPAQIPQIYISKTPVKHIEFDVELLGACDDVVVELCRLAKWKLEHEMIPEKVEIDVSLQEGKESRYIFTVK